MDKIIESIVNKNYEEANGLIKEEIGKIVISKLHEMKKMIAAKNTNLSEAIVQADGKVHLATGEMILPSVYRLRRGLTEATAEIKVGKAKIAEPSMEDKLSKDYDKGEAKQTTYDDRRAKEIDLANLGVHPETRKRTARGPETIMNYKKRKEKYFNKAAGAALRVHGDDVAAAAKHMHGLVTGVENQHEPWMASHKEYDDINRNDFETLIRQAMRQRDAAGTPEGKAAAEARATAKKEGDEVRAMNKMVDDHAMAVYLAKKQGKPIPEAPWTKTPAKTAVGVKNASHQAKLAKAVADINDEVPFKE